MTQTKPSRAASTPAMLAQRLQLAPWQITRAENEHLLPARDRTVGWSADLTDQIAAGDIAELRRAIGTVPDMAATDAAEWFTARFGFTITADAVRDLGRQERLPIHHRNGEWPIYDGHAIEAWRDTSALRAANVNGRTLMASEAAATLRIRRTDFDHIVRAGLITPIRSKLTGYTSKRRDPGMDLYRGGDVDRLDAHDEIAGIPWDLIRDAKPGSRSALAQLPTKTEA